MRIFVFSDWRVQSMDSLFESIDELDRPPDFIVYAGDDVNRFRQQEERNVFSDLAEKTTQGTVLAVCGNDDDQLMRSVLDAPGVHDLHDEPFVYDEYVFIGQEGAIKGTIGRLLYTEEEIENHLENQYSGFEDKIPVLVSHVPPHQILDIAQRFGQEHIGSTAVRSFIEKFKPVLTVCGHCHQMGGQAQGEEFGTVINIASHDDDNAKGRYSVIEIEQNRVDYELSSTREEVEHQLLRLSEVGKNRIEHLLDVDIKRLDQVDEENYDLLCNLPGSSDWHARKWIQEAQAIRNDGVVLQDRSDFDFLEHDNLILIDIETDLNQEHIWLIGVYNYANQEFIQIFEKDDEEKLLRDFVQYLQKSEEPAIVYYGCNYFDRDCLQRRLKEYGMQDSLKYLEDAHDLGISVKNSLLGGFTKITLSSIAEYLAEYEYSYPDIDGRIVGRMYTEYHLDGKEPDWDKLLEYNKDDIFALKTVVDSLKGILAEDTEQVGG